MRRSPLLHWGMQDFNDLQLRNEQPPVEPERRRAWWPVPLVIGLLALLGYLGWSAFRQSGEPAQGVRVEQDDALARAPQRVDPAAEPGEEVDLPPLAETDPLVRRLVQQLSAHPRIAAWLATDQLLRNFTVVTYNVAQGRSPARQLSAIRPTGDFVVSGQGATVTIDRRSYARYNDYADAMDSLDARDAARVYATLKPRIQEAYRELGYPEGDFDEVLRRAIVELLGTPVLEADLRVTSKSVVYEYADPRLQSLSAAQRHLLRMGPRNVRIVQAKLREIAPHLGIAPESLPTPRG